MLNFKSFKLCSYLFGLVLFVFLGIKQYVSDPKEYVEQIKNDAMLVSFTLDKFTCNSMTKAPDQLVMIAKENGATLYAHIDGEINCRNISQQLKVGDTVFSHIDKYGQVFSMRINGKSLQKFDDYLNESEYHFKKYSYINFVIAFLFMMLFLRERAYSK